MNEKCKNCKHLGMNIPCCVCIWKNDFYEPLKAPTPPEMPDSVMPPMPVVINSEARSTFQPLLTGYCVRWQDKVGKKEANSCVGCAVGCPGKGQQEPNRPLIVQPEGKESGREHSING